MSLYAGLHGSEPCDHFILLIKKQIMKFKKFIIPALCMAMLSAGCSGQDPVTPGNGQNGNGGTNENIENGLQVTASTTVINADGQDAARINVYYDKVKLSLDAVAFYDAKSNDVLDLSKFTIEDNTLVYTVTEPGEFSFWVAYKTHNTKDRPTTISAVEFSVPDAPEDPQPDNTSFVRRTLITQFTGLGCGYCPFMIAAMEDVRKSAEYADKSVLAACHTYGGDPYQPDVPLDYAMGVSTYPYVNFDFQTGVGNNGYNNNVSNIKQAIDKSLSADAGAGISVGMEVAGNKLVARVTVKAARSGSFRVGAWVLEDGLTGTQLNNGMKGDYDFNTLEFDGLFISNGPGDPDTCEITVNHIREAMKKKKPIFGICMGNQLLAKAGGAKTFKLKYGHRSHNQPVRMAGTEKCFITSQNHGYAVDNNTLGDDWEPLFLNMNDGTNEGIRHKRLPFFSAQFHPEAASGPTDTEFLFDTFIDMI